MPLPATKISPPRGSKPSKGAGPPGAALERAKRFGLQEQTAIAQQIGIVLGEHDVHVDDRPAGVARRSERALAGVEELLRLAAAAVEGKWNASLRVADVVLEMKRDECIARGCIADRHVGHGRSFRPSA